MEPGVIAGRLREAIDQRLVKKHPSTGAELGSDQIGVIMWRTEDQHGTVHHVVSFTLLP